MVKAMIFSLQFQALRSASKHCRFPLNLSVGLCYLFSSPLACHHIYAYLKTPNRVEKNPVVFDYLVETLNFSKTYALIVSECFSQRNYPTANIKRAVSFLRSYGFSDEQIVSSVLSFPRIIFLSTEKNLKPKFVFFQELGLSREGLSDFISKRPSMLLHSLGAKFKPCVTVIKEVLENGGSGEINNYNKDLLFILSKCCWLIPSVSTLSSNISILRSIGISGADLSSLLKREPRLLILNEAKLKRNISEVLDMGFVIGSRMFLQALRARSSVSDATFSRKFEFFMSYGISRNEFLEMVRKTPSIMKLSESNLRSAIEFFLHFLDKSVLVRCPILLLFSMENRVMPRYRVFELIKSKGLMKKEPSFTGMMQLSESKFLEKYILRFENDIEELLMAYKGPLLDLRKEVE